MVALLQEPILANKDFLRSMALRAKHRLEHGLPQAPSLAIPETTLADFVTRRPWQIDRHAFDWDQHRYLLPLYAAFCLDPHTTDHLTITLIKGAQIGASVWAMLGLIFLAVKFPGRKNGYFLPDQTMSYLFSGDRFKPMVQSNPIIGQMLGDASTDNMRLRMIGQSSIFFSYMGGTTSTESLPLLGIYFDEVRRMAMTDVSLAEQRISHSEYPVNIKLSTAGYPGTDIDYYYSLTTQQEWHTTCQCPDGVVLADLWPECLGFHGEEVFYRCPRCSTVIDNPQDGRYIAHAPLKDTLGFRIPQTLSLAPLHRPAALWARYTNPKEDRGEFYRSVLGRPYVDPEAVLVTEDDLIACENTDLHWETDGVNCALGLDQMGGWNDVVILKHGRGGKFRLVHLERIEGDDPWADGRLDGLMRRYDVSHACVDLNPNYNESLRFCKRWYARAHLVTYSSTDRADMFAWRDRRRPKDQIANEPDVKFKYVVTLQRYKALDYALGLFRERLIEMPHRRGLIQTCRDEHGVTRPVFMAEELFWEHMKRMVRQKHVLDEDQLTYKMQMVKVGSDPHYAFSFCYAVAAASRLGTGRVAIL
jgi:hypothetical protein